MTEAIQVVIDQMTGRGVCVSALEVSGCLVRVKVAGDKGGKRSGWYVLYEVTTANGNRFIVGCFGNWKDPDCPESGWKVTPNGSDITATEKEEIREYRHRMRVSIAEERQRIADEACLRAGSTWADFPDTGLSTYLQKKGVKAYGLRFSRGSVIVPVRRRDGKLVGLQFIRPDGTKRFLTGTEKRGAFHLIGEYHANNPVCVSEGYSTAASVHEATGWPVLVAFDAGNIKAVVVGLREKCPDAEILVCGDDDHETSGNPGRIKALEAAREVGALVVFPRFNAAAGRSDWNDLHLEQGLDEVKSQLYQSIAPTPTREGGGEGEFSPYERPELIVRAGELHNTVDQIEERLIDSPANIFQHGGGVVTVIHTDERIKKQGIHRPEGAPVIHRVDSTHLAEIANRYIATMKYDGRSGDCRPVDVSRRCTDTLLARGTWRFSRLLGTIEAPIILSDGTVIDEPGYNEETELYFTSPPPKDYSRPRSRPTRKEVSAAKNLLVELVGSFPFVTSADKAATIAAMLTALVRRILPSAPFPLFSAPSPGTGKSLLCDLVAVVALGRRATVLSLGEDDAEMVKRVTGCLLGGDQMIVADNIECRVKSDFLCQIATQSMVRLRPLGASSMVSVPTNTLFMLNGNNVQVIGDLRRRVMLIQLDAGTERPEQRVYPGNFLEHVSGCRGRIISALLTLVTSYISAGAPVIDVPPLGGFADWDRMVRRPLIFAGLPDPLLASEGLRDNDPDLEATRALFAAWVARFGDRTITAAYVIDEVMRSTSNYRCDELPDSPGLAQALQVICAEKINSRRLGNWLRKHRDRVIDNLRLQRGPDNRVKVATWKIIHV